MLFLSEEGLPHASGSSLQRFTVSDMQHMHAICMCRLSSRPAILSLQINLLKAASVLSSILSDSGISKNTDLVNWIGKRAWLERWTWSIIPPKCHVQVFGYTPVPPIMQVSMSSLWFLICHKIKENNSLK